MSPLYTCITPIDGRNAEFLLLWYFQTNKWHTYIQLNRAQNGARHDRVGMTMKLMDSIPVTLPCLEEQRKIAAFLSDFDDSIGLSKREQEQYKLLKKALMQRMFV